MAQDGRYAKLLRRPSQKAFPDFSANLDESKEALSKPILVVGAGGLGCELLKDLALVGFTNIHVIDGDEVDVTNLNRQFLFRADDVGQPKSTVAAKFVMKRVPACKITSYCCWIQDMVEKDSNFYRQFSIIVLGLDSIKARRWMNSHLVGLVAYDERGDLIPSSVIPMLDGGTEGWKGSVRAFVPKVAACFECAIDMFPPAEKFQECTMKTNPRQPEHCIAWAKTMAWTEEWPFGKDVSIDTDKPEHMTWLFEKAKEHAAKFNIEGVTYKKTMGVVKNIIPAIASTNAMCAAATANEAFKFVTRSSLPLNNWMMFNSGTGAHTYTYEHERNPECPTCAGKPVSVTVDGEQTLETFINEFLREDSRLMFGSVLNIRHQQSSKSIYWPKFAKKRTAENMPKKMNELISDGDSLLVKDRDSMDQNSSGLELTVHFA
eukprot:TRINITY_DN1169_c0_g1_i1.p2 TRINITY_DN1169_c0_g1~~TRINITY_DN1169_c0_g1_i1.p2  ORF type:complete len:433 (-),score=141.55 TRINITY_DN1169_c0_g1_i1:144-1442(-)